MDSNCGLERSASGITSSWNPQDRGRSLVSMRTFYAYGARSTSIGGRREGRSSSVVSSSLPAHYNPPGYTHRSFRASAAPDPTPFVRNSLSRATISSSCIRSIPRPSYRSTRVSPVRSPVVTSSPSTTFTPRPVLQSAPLRLTQLSHRPLFSPIERVRPVSSRLLASPPYSSPERPARRETSHVPSQQSQSQERHHVSQVSHHRESTSHNRDSSSRASAAESRPISVVETPPVTPVIQTPVPTIDEKSLIELDELRSRNKKLEEELAKLQLMIKDGDRSNRELKRKLLESEAETKVWQTKAERVVEPQIIEVVRPAKAPEVILHHHPIDDTLYDKLEMTADKMAKLNAVNDLKLLQSHIESALTEITSK